MTRARFKITYLKALYLGVFLTFSLPLYMYFSHDVAALKNEYPHAHFPPGPTAAPDFKLRAGKPSSWVKLNEISTYAKWAIVLSEDWGFYQHEGIDLNQMRVALNEMMTVNRFRGASTITQQMVKNVFLNNQPTLWRKFHEIILSQKVERVLSKDRILEVYLNCIEFGPNIYGIKKASYHYFGKHPSSIQPREAAFLAMLLPSPKRYYISFKRKKLTAFARSRIISILFKMKMGKIISLEEYEMEKNSLMAWEN